MTDKPKGQLPWDYVVESDCKHCRDAPSHQVFYVYTDDKAEAHFPDCKACNRAFDTVLYQIPEAEARGLWVMQKTYDLDDGKITKTIAALLKENDVLRSRLANFEEAAKTAWSVICKNCSGKSDDSTEHRAMEKLRQALEAK